MALQPAEDVGCELAVVRAGFDEVQCFESGFLSFEFGEPFGALEREQSAEERADADAGEEVAAPPDGARGAFVVAERRVVKREFHEARGGHRSGLRDLATDDFGEGIQRLAVGEASARLAATSRHPEAIWPKLTPSST